MSAEDDAVAVRLVDGATYVNGYGERFTIGGTCPDHPAFCWSIQGYWFDRQWGRFVGYSPELGHHVPARLTWRDLVRRVDP